MPARDTETRAPMLAAKQPIRIKSAKDLEVLRRSCRLAADTLLMVGDRIRVGMTTLEIDRLVHGYIVDHGAYPSPLHYHGFPKSVCTSINEVVWRGICQGWSPIRNVWPSTVGSFPLTGTLLAGVPST